MEKSTIVGAALAGVAALVLIIGALMFFFAPDPNALRSPDELEKIAFTGAPDDQEKAVLELSRFDPKDARVVQAKEALRRILKEHSLPQQVRGAAVQGLGAYRDWQSIEIICDAMDDDDLYVRSRAGVAVMAVLNLNYPYKADASPEDRKVQIAKYRDIGVPYKLLKEREQTDKSKSP